MARLYLIVPAAMCVLALLHLPYGYYQFLKLVVTFSAGFLAICGWQFRSHLMTVVFGLVALTYNPVLPLSLGREIWSWVNVATAAVFMLGLLVIQVFDRRPSGLASKPSEVIGAGSSST